MNYEEFLRCVINNLPEYLPDHTNLEISEQHLNKAQGESYTGISIRPANSMAGAVLNTERFYEMCEHEDVSMDSVMRLIADKVEEALNSIPDFDLSLFSDYERIRERLIPQVI